LELSVARCRQEHGGLADDATADFNLRTELSPIDRLGEDLGFSDDEEDNAENLRLLVVSHLSDTYHPHF
jgi:hypothetical protein